jgi:hypothetical protein
MYVHVNYIIQFFIYFISLSVREKGGDRSLITLWRRAIRDQDDDDGLVRVHER